MQCSAPGIPSCYWLSLVDKAAPIAALFHVPIRAGHHEPTECTELFLPCHHDTTITHMKPFRVLRDNRTPRRQPKGFRVGWLVGVHLGSEPGALSGLQDDARERSRRGIPQTLLPRNRAVLVERERIASRPSLLEEPLGILVPIRVEVSPDASDGSGIDDVGRQTLGVQLDRTGSVLILDREGIPDNGTLVVLVTLKQGACVNFGSLRLENHIDRHNTLSNLPDTGVPTQYTIHNTVYSYTIHLAPVMTPGVIISLVCI